MDTIIDLTVDNNAQGFSEGRVIHQLELNQVMQIVNSLIYEADIYKRNHGEIIRRHNTITISGERGSGKTSFLMTLRSKFSNQVEVLRIIDPTLIEEKGHIFLNIIARIQEVVSEVYDIKKIHNCDKDRWNETLKSLADGLPMLDGIGGNLDPADWNDSTFVMLDGLRRVTGANKLEENFHKFVKLSLELIGKDAFIIMFDDVDTDFLKGWPILEMIRKYLTSPQIITIISGDLGLYSMLIRKKQWKNFGKTLLKNEYDKESEDFPDNKYIDLVAKLESQYALKILKPEYRISLSTIAAKPKEIIEKIKIITNSSLPPCNIKSFYQKSFEDKFGIREGITQDLYVDFFLSLPLRSQISLMKALCKNSDNIYSSSVSKDIFNVFYTELKSLDVSTWELVNNYGLTNIYLLKCLFDNRILDEGSQFIPKTNSIHTNGALVALGFLFSERLNNNPYEIFDYIIRISNIISKTDSWGYEPSEDYYSEANIRDYINYSRCLYDYGLQKSASLQGAYYTSFLNNKSIIEGIIPLKRLVSKDKKTKNSYDVKLDEVFRLSNKQSIKDYIGWIPAFGVQDRHGYSSIFYSFNNIIASIGDVISAYHTHNSMERALDEFVRMSQLRYYNNYKNSNANSSQERVEEEFEDTNHLYFNNIICTEFVLEFVRWIQEWRNMFIPPYIIGRIMIRTYFSFNRIPVSFKTTVAQLLHRQLICFLNAILVEEIMEFNDTAKIILNNPTSSDKNFITNYENNRNSIHPLFDYILSCPLIKSYINPSLLDSIIVHYNYESNIYTMLDEVKIKMDSIGKINRPIQATEEDVVILLNNLVNDEIPKDLIFRGDDSVLIEKIKEIFSNTRSPKREVLDSIKDILYRLWN